MGCRGLSKKKKGPNIRKLLNSKRTYNVEEDIHNDKPGRHCVAYCDGWSVILDRTNSKRECFLWNSVSGQKVDFPRIQTDFPKFSKCILSSPPTHRRCTIWFFFNEFLFTVYCQIGDREWTKHQFDYQLQYFEIAIPSAIIFDTKLYAITDKGVLIQIELRSDNRITIEKSLARSRFLRAKKQILVDSFGDLFLVRIFSFSSLDVYKVNFPGKKWEKVYNLGDRAFFLCSHYSVSFEVRDAPGIKNNSVYFTEDNDQSLYIFNLEEESLSVRQHGPNSGALQFSYDGLMPVLRFQAGQEIHDREFVEEAVDGEKGNEAEEGDDVDGQKCIWSKLPMDLQESILGCLSIGRDYMNFRVVCRRWRSLAPRFQWIPNSTSSSSSSVKRPWLMFFQKRENSKFCNFYDPIDNFAYHMNSAIAQSNSEIRFSNDGWLLLSQGERSMFFYEPFKKVSIEIPDLPQCYCLNGVGFSASPTSSNFIVCGISHICEKWVKIFYFDPSLKTWARIDLPNGMPFLPSWISPIFLNGYFYFLGEDGKLGAFRSTGAGFSWRILNKPQPLHFPSTLCRNFLVPFEEELFSVFVGNLGEWVKVFKLDELGNDWKEIKSLGNLMLFVSQTTSLAVLTKEEKMMNKIYFPIFSNNDGKTTFYCLETCKFQTFGSGNGNGGLYDTKEMVNCTWVDPELVPSFC